MATAYRYVSRAELDGWCGARLEGFPLAGLWATGDLAPLAAPCVAVVGTRAPSDAARRRAHRLAADLGAAGVCVVSGLALGIDAAAHTGAVEARSPTVGVIGGGHDRFFPRRNADLACRMVVAGGSVVSPFPPETVPRPGYFLARNGVIAALSDAVVVVEAAERSGALNTAGWAAERGIPVLAFPGDVERPKAAGTNALIRDGATLVRDATDVLAALPAHIAPPLPRRAEPPARAAPDSAPVRRILEALAELPQDAATLADRLGVAPAALLPVVVALELEGRIVAGRDGYALPR